MKSTVQGGPTSCLSTTELQPSPIRTLKLGNAEQLSECNPSSGLINHF